MYSLKEEKISQLTPFSVLADNKRIRNKTIEGKSIQDGTPIPEVPVEIQSIGDNVNLLDLSNLESQTIYGAELTKNSDGSFTLNGTTTNSYGFNVVIDNPITLKSNINYTLNIENIGSASSTSGSIIAIREMEDTNLFNKNFADGSKTYTPTKDETINYIRIYIDKDVTFDNFTIFPKLQKIKSLSTLYFFPFYSSLLLFFLLVAFL